MSDITGVKAKFDKIASVSSKKSKEILLKQYENDELFKECLKFLLDDSIVTGLSTKKMSKNVPIYENTWNDIRDVFEYVKANNTGTDENISMIKTFCKAQDGCEEFCEQLFCKKYRLGCNERTVNKVYPGFIPTFDIMLGSKFDFDKPPKEEMYITEKVDGLRCATLIRNGNIKMLSRQNKEFKGLVEIVESINKLGLDNIMLDGELVAKDCIKEEVFKETTKRVNNKNEIKTGVAYLLYDIIDIEEFDNKYSEVKYSDRRKQLDKLAWDDNIEVLPVLYKGKDMEKIKNILGEVRSMECEGLMCNLDKPYEFKRSKTLLKIKVFDSCDLKIIGFEEGEGRLKGTLGKIICDYKGYELGVGSGFSDADRDEIWNNQSEYINRIAEIQYFEQTSNDKGELSVRFPVFKCMREQGKEVSYN